MNNFDVSQIQNQDQLEIENLKDNKNQLEIEKNNLEEKYRALVPRIRGCPKKN